MTLTPRWEDELANIRHKKIMDCFPGEEEYMGLELKRKCGFGKDGYKNFEGMITELQMPDLSDRPGFPSEKE